MKIDVHHDEPCRHVFPLYLFGRSTISPKSEITMLCSCPISFFGAQCQCWSIRSLCSACVGTADGCSQYRATDNQGINTSVDAATKQSEALLVSSSLCEPAQLPDKDHTAFVISNPRLIDWQLKRCGKEFSIRSPGPENFDEAESDCPDVSLRESQSPVHSGI